MTSYGCFKLYQTTVSDWSAWDLSPYPILQITADRYPYSQVVIGIKSNVAIPSLDTVLTIPLSVLPSWSYEDVQTILDDMSDVRPNSFFIGTGGFIFNFGGAGPSGATGPAGPGATVTVGTTTTGLPGTSSLVSATGTPTNAILNFTIPRGDPGAQGVAGVSPTIAVSSTTTLTAGSSATVVNAGTSSNVQLQFGIPAGPAGANGSAATATNPITDELVVWGSTSTSPPSLKSADTAVTLAYPFNLTSTSSNVMTLSGNQNSVNVQILNTGGVTRRASFTMGRSGSLWQFGTDSSASAQDDFFIFSYTAGAQLFKITTAGLLSMTGGFTAPRLDLTTKTSNPGGSGTFWWNSAANTRPQWAGLGTMALTTDITAADQSVFDFLKTTTTKIWNSQATCQFKLRRYGRQVTLLIEAFSSTDGAIDSVITWPAGTLASPYAPIAQQTYIIQVIVASATTTGILTVNTDGSVIIGKGITGTTWGTAGANNGFPDVSATYMSV